MRWEIPEKVRCDMLVWSGPNFSGRQKLVRVFPVGGRQGDELLPEDVGSIMLVGPVGTRVVLIADPAEQGWEARPWRAITVMTGQAFKAKTGKPAVRVPDIDFLDKGNARRTDPDFQETYDQVNSLAEGTTWSFGRSGAQQLKNAVHAIRFEKV